MKRFLRKIVNFIIIIILIAIALYVGFGFITGGFKATITHTVSINARPPVVWSVLTDFEKYPDWNPFLRITGTEFEPGKKIHITLLDKSGKETNSFTPKLLTYNRPESIIWKGSLLFGGIFDGRHQFYLEVQKDGTTLFTQTEEFSGILIPLTRFTVLKETKEQFINMNNALKTRAEMMR